MAALLLAIGAEGFVSGADLSALLEARYFLFLVLHVTGYSFDKGHKALVTCCESGVVQQQLLEHGFFVHRSGGKVIEVPFRGLDSDFCLLYLIVKRGVLFILTGGRICHSKFCTAIVVLCFYPCLGVGLLVGRLPLRPGLFPFRALFSIIVGTQKLLTCEHLCTGK